VRNDPQLTTWKGRTMGVPCAEALLHQVHGDRRIVICGEGECKPLGIASGGEWGRRFKKTECRWGERVVR